MKKTLAEILAENTNEIIRQAEAINRLIEASKKMGTTWPEIDEEKRHVCWHCSGTGCSYCDNTGYLIDNDNGVNTYGDDELT